MAGRPLSRCSKFESSAPDGVDFNGNFTLANSKYYRSMVAGGPKFGQRISVVASG